MAKLLYQGNSLTAVSSDADYLKYDNTTSGLAATNAQSAIDEVVVNAGVLTTRVASAESAISSISTDHDFTISTTWLDNTTYGDYSTYPYYQSIASDLFTDDSHPDCLVFGADPSSFMSETERDNKSYLCEEVMFTSSGITLLATDATTTALTLRVKGI